MPSFKKPRPQNPLKLAGRIRQDNARDLLRPPSVRRRRLGIKLRRVRARHQTQ